MGKEDLKNAFSQVATKVDFNREFAKVATLESVQALSRQVAENSNDLAEIRTQLKNINHRMDILINNLESLDSKIDRTFNRMSNALDKIIKRLTDIAILKKF